MTGSTAVLYNIQRCCACGWIPGSRNDAGDDLNGLNRVNLSVLCCLSI